MLALFELVYLRFEVELLGPDDRCPRLLYWNMEFLVEQLGFGVTNLARRMWAYFSIFNSKMDPPFTRLHPVTVSEAFLVFFLSTLSTNTGAREEW